MHTTKQRYPLGWVLLHWIQAVVFLGMLALGFFMTAVPKWSAFKIGLYAWHKSLGLFAFALSWFRWYVWMVYTPPDMVSMPPWQRVVMQWAHGTLYMMMLCLPLTGWVMASASQKPPVLAGIKLYLPLSLSASWAPFFDTAHSVCAWTLSGILAMHVLGVCNHVWIEKRNVLKRMWI